MAESLGILSGIRRTLVLCPHTDDEFGCAGTIVRLIDTGVEVRYIALSRCEESVPQGLPKDILEKECRGCTQNLGIKPEKVEIWNYSVRYFEEKRQAILEDFVRLNREYSPDLILLPTSSDIHQDHSVVQREGVRAFKFSTILGYELPQNTLSFENSAFIKLSANDIQRKIDALARYESQKFRKYSSPEFIRSLAKVRGVQANAEYAEGFELIRLIIS